MSKNLFITILILCFNLCNLSFGNNIKSFSDLDIAKLLCIHCAYEALLTSTNKKLTTKAVGNNYFYLDIENKQVYCENETPTEVREFDDKFIVFKTIAHTDKRTITAVFKLNRYTGRCAVKGTIRHDYGAIASFVYANMDFEGFGNYEVIEQGQKF